MKKSSLVVLTIVAALSMSSCSMQNVPQNMGPPDPVYADDMSDTTRYQPMAMAPVPQYDYYYRSYFFDDMYRVFFPTRYYQAITRPGYVPHHMRRVRGDMAVNHRSRSMPASNRRGGFGRTGATHAVVS